MCIGTIFPSFITYLFLLYKILHFNIVKSILRFLLCLSRTVLCFFPFFFFLSLDYDSVNVLIVNAMSPRSDNKVHQNFFLEKSVC